MQYLIVRRASPDIAEQLTRLANLGFHRRKEMMSVTIDCNADQRARHLVAFVVQIVSSVFVIMVTVCTAGHAAELDGQWPADKARQWYDQQPWLVGCNFLPSTAINDIEMWQAETFDAKTIDRELGWAQDLGFNTVRVFINYVVWKADPDGLKDRMNQFLAIADRHGLKSMVILLDDCFRQTPKVGKQPDPIPGVANSQWFASPGQRMVQDTAAWVDLERYVKDIVSTFGHDRRLVVWDLYNEPSQSLPLVEAVFRWARQIGPDQPLTSCVYGGKCDPKRIAEISDVISFHGYGPLPVIGKTVHELGAYGRPVLCTEWLRRPNSRFETHLPFLKQHKIGAWNWGLVAGRTQTYFPWDSVKDALEPTVWCHDLLRSDGTPFSPREVRFIRVTTGMLPPSAMPATKVLVPTAQKDPVAWRYTLEKPADNWCQRDFDDGAWKVGLAPFGKEQASIARKPNTIWTGSDIWLRREVELPYGEYSDLSLDIHYDEEPEVFVDGILAWKARRFNAAYESFEIGLAAAAVLRTTGKHVLAVHCRQTEGGQYIDVGITGTLKMAP
jgi:hypothetical protein